MPKVQIHESITVVRDGNRVAPTIGKLFELSKEEMAQLDATRPSAYSKLKDLEEDPASIPVDENSTKLPAVDAPAKATPAAKARTTTDDKAADL